jgi:carbon-monoxide dehydrogenase medium subunit
VLTALGARFTIQGPNGSRTATPADFFLGPLTTAIADDEILTSVEVPRLAENQVAEYAKMAHPASGYAVVGGAVVLTMDGDRCTAASVAVGGAVPVPTRATSVQNALAGSTLSADSITAAANQVSNDLGEVIGDFYASAEYRKAMAAVEIRHAIFHATGLAHH